MIEDVIPESGTWNEPGGYYLNAAMDALGIDRDAALRDLEEIPEEDRVGRLPAGKYPEWDKVYARAWSLRIADEE